MFDISSNNAWINRSDTLITVYDSLYADEGGMHHAGGNIIGHIYVNEFFTAIGDTTYENGNCVVNIYFRTAAGNMASGWINIADFPEYPWYDWVNYQEPYHYYNSNGSTLIDSTVITISGTGYRQFSLSRAVTVRAISGSVYTTLNPDNTLIATNTSHTGQNYPGYMEFQKVKIGQGGWANLCGTTYGYVDLDLAHGSMPNNRSVL
jgi:hypothetical protein